MTVTQGVEEIQARTPALLASTEACLADSRFCTHTMMASKLVAIPSVLNAGKQRMHFVLLHPKAAVCFVCCSTTAAQVFITKAE
jgi:hypothetical protein